MHRVKGYIIALMQNFFLNINNKRGLFIRELKLCIKKQFSKNKKKISGKMSNIRRKNET